MKRIYKLSAMAGIGLFLLVAGSSAADEIKLNASRQDIRMYGDGTQSHRTPSQKPLHIDQPVDSSPNQDKSQLDSKVKEIGHHILDARRRPEQSEELMQLRERIATLRQALIDYKGTVHSDFHSDGLVSLDGKKLQEPNAKSRSLKRNAVNEALNQLKEKRQILSEKSIKDPQEAVHFEKVNELLNRIQEEVEAIMVKPGSEDFEKVIKIIKQLDIKPRSRAGHHSGPSFRSLSLKAD